MPKWTVVIAALAASLFVDVARSDACTCVGNRSFLDVARDEPIAVVGHVVGVGEQVYGGPASVELDVEWVAKGAVASRTIRIWDSGAASDCNSLSDAKVGRSFAITLWPVTNEGGSDYWRMLDLHRRPGASISCPWARARRRCCG